MRQFSYRHRNLVLVIKNDLEKARDQYVVNIGNLIVIVGPCMSFYLFTLSSQLFRDHLKNLFYRQQAI
jgi:hypothetical protein